MSAKEKLNQIEDKIKKLIQIPQSLEETAFLQLCQKAISAGREGNYPVAAALLSGQELKHVAANRSFFPKFRSSGHAEMLTLDMCEDSEKVEDLHLLTTLEPCLMCIARIGLSKVTKVTYLADDPGGGGTRNIKSYPAAFAESLASLKLEKFKGNKQILDIGKDLYKVGEEIWSNYLTKR